MARSCRLVLSWPLHGGVGSGVVVGAVGMGRALHDRGYEAQFIAPKTLDGGYLSVSYQRMRFGLGLPDGLKSDDGSPVITFDFDGFALDPSVRFAVVNGGVLGDIVRFESGVVKYALKLMARLERRAAHRADRVFTPSRYAKETVCRLYGVPEEKVTVMRHGIFYDGWSDAVARSSSPSPRPPTVLCVARLYRRKGIDALLRAWVAVRSAIPDARLRIVGDGLERTALATLSKELGLESSITFEGHVEGRGALARCYADCDIFCLPSLHETFGLVFLEAMAAGKPVVALNATAVPEVVRDGVDGLLAAEGDIAGLADRVISLLKNDALRARMGRQAQERVASHFQWDDVVTPLIEWMEAKNA